MSWRVKAFDGTYTPEKFDWWSFQWFPVTSPMDTTTYWLHFSTLDEAFDFIERPVVKEKKPKCVFFYSRPSKDKT